MQDKRKISPLLRAATFVPDTFNAADNTIEVIAATEDMQVPRSTWDGQYLEVLGMKSSEIRLDRLNSGANVLDNHDSYSSVREAVVGVIESAQLQGKKLITKLRLSNREDVKPLIEDIKNGIIRNVSIGYRVYAFQITEEQGKLPIYRAIDWEPYEVSFVSLPADYMAGVRSQNMPTHEVEIFSNNLNRNTMPEGKVTNEGTDQTRSQASTGKEGQEGQSKPTVATTVDIEAERKAASKAVQKRSSDILNAVRAAGFDLAYAETLINDENMTVDQARTAIIEKMGATRSQQTQTNNSTPVIVIADESDKYRNVIATTLALRSGQMKDKDFKPELVSATREHRSMSLLDIAKACLTRANISFNGMDKQEIAIRATSSTSDFPVILQNIIHMVLLNNYQAVTDTWKKFCMVGSVSDFRAHQRLRMGSFGKLDVIGENGQYKTLAIPDAEQQSISAQTVGNLINVSRKMIVNDDLNAFARLSAMLGRAAARSIEIDVYALLAANPVMSDGVALFHATHGNLMAATAMSAIQFDALRVKMAQQKDPTGNDFLDLRPSVLLTGISQGANARVINDALYDPDTANKLQKPNLAKGIFNNIVDTARITDTTYYGFADPNEEPVIEVAFLDGVQEPFMENWLEQKTDGMQWKVRLDYGVGAIGWRGAVKNPGA